MVWFGLQTMLQIQMALGRKKVPWSRLGEATDEDHEVQGLQAGTCTAAPVQGAACALRGLRRSRPAGGIGGSSEDSEHDHAQHPFVFLNKTEFCFRSRYTHIATFPFSCQPQQAEQLGREDQHRLHRNRKLVLMVDLDQTLIHTTEQQCPQMSTKVRAAAPATPPWPVHRHGRVPCMGPVGSP